MNAVGAVLAIVDDARAAMDRLARELADPGIAFDAPVATATVGAIAQEELAARHVLFGMGFVVAPERLGHPLMAWFQALGAERDVRRLDAGATGTGAVRPYEHLEWYAVPRESGAPHMTGPYVDLLCTDQATISFSSPLVLDGRFAGVVGADVTVRAFEAAVVAALRDAGDGALVVTSEGRVAASTDPGVLVQRRLRDEVLAGYVLEPVPGTQLSVALPR